jgi:hypothetical protein
MKFNYKLSRNENMYAWMEFNCKAPHTQTSKLNADEKSWLFSLNDSLRQIEDKFLQILDAKYIELQARVNDPSDWMFEFNLEYFITFYLREDDPEYDNDDDNILMELQGMHSIHGNRDWGFGATHVDHAISVMRLGNEQHCYTFHQLYDHCHLDWRDILRIGNLYVELKIDEQSGMLNSLPVLVRQLAAGTRGELKCN